MRVKIESSTQNDYTIHMTILQLTLNDKILADIDSVIEETDSNRVEFLKQAIEMALRQYRIRQPEKLDEWDKDPTWLALDDEQITEKLNQFCATNDTKIDPELMQMQVQAIGETW